MIRSLIRFSVVLLLITADVAVADTDDKDPVKARELRTEAIKAANDSNWSLCKTKAAEAWSISQNPVTAGLLGTCEAELGEFRAAAEHLDYALRLDDSPDRQAANQKKFDAVAGKVGIVEVQTTPSDCTVLSKGATVGTTKAGPLRVFLDPGPFEVTATKKGLADASKTGDVKAGERVTIALKLEEPSTVGPTPSKKPIWPYVLGGSLSAVGIGVGIGTAVVAANKWSALEDLSTSSSCAPSITTACLSDGESLASEHDSFRAGAIASFTIGGAFLVGTIIYAAIPAKTSDAASKQSASWTLVPVASENFGGLSWAGSF